MVKIEITILDEQGKQLSQLASVDLELGTSSLYEIETGVEKLRIKMLPELSSELLKQAQKEFNQEKKDSEVVCNGTSTVKIKTIHGQFAFPLQKYLVNGESCNYFDLTSQLTNGYISPGLQEFVAYYSNRLSYEEVENLVERVSGEKLLSDQKIC